MLSRSAPIPWWVRFADAAAIAGFVIAAAVFTFGGFREATPLGRVSITSAIRPLLFSALLLLLRHAGQRDPNLAARLVVGVRAWWNSSSTRAVWPSFLLSRAGILAVAFFGIAIIGYAPNTPPWRVYDNDVLNLAARWDTGWYLGIAERGYEWHPERADTMQNIAFFPLYPVLMRYLSLLMGRQTLIAGVLISLAGFLLGLRYLFQFARERVGDERAVVAVAFLSAYPFALFFSTAYTEGLFLVASLAACYHFEKRESFPAAAWGLAAGLARPNGCVLSVVLAAIALRDVRATGWPEFAKRLAIASAPGVGMLMFSAYMWQLTGNPLQWAANHAAYGRVYRGVGDLVVDRIDYVRINGLYDYLTSLALDVVNLVPLLFALGAIWPVYRLLGGPYALLIGVNVIPALLMGGTLSMGRVTSVLFPLFVWLAVAVPAQWRGGTLTAMAMLQALFAIAFFTWRPLV